MIACLSIPGFELKAALRKQPSLSLRPAALAPEGGPHTGTHTGTHTGAHSGTHQPLLGPVTSAAEAAGGLPRVRLGGGPPTCPQLVPVGPGPPAAGQAWGGVGC